jgi:prepilin-type N-terminal cleavage/methylation domain-containing protein
MRHWNRIRTADYSVRPSRAAPGFSLIEMAVVLFVIALLLGSLLVPLGTQVEQRQISDTQKAMEEIKEALIGFAVTNGYLPCPDRLTGANSNDGAEDRSGTNCAVTEGNLPWQTLGIPAPDAWGNRYRYLVTGAFADSSPVFTLATSGNLRVCQTSGCAATAALANNVPAVVISHGRNGWGATNALSGATLASPTSANELENIGTSAGYTATTVVSRINTQVGSTVGEFDDIVVWISTPVLMNRMVAAGKLP